MSFLRRILEEQPFRLFVRALVKRLPVGVRSLERWDAVDRPHYLCGIVAAAELAKSSGVDSIYLIEFGVAQGKVCCSCRLTRKWWSKKPGLASK